MLKFQNNWNSLKHPLGRILERNKQNLSLSPLKRSGRPRTTTPRTDCKIKQLCQKQPFISSSEIKRSMQELISVTTRTIRNRMHKDFKTSCPQTSEETPDYTKNGPAKAWILLPLQTTGQKKTGRKWCLLTNPPSYSLLPTNPSFADHMDLHQRDSRYLQPTVKHPPSVMCVGVLFQPRPRWSLFLAKTTNNECLTVY